MLDIRTLGFAPLISLMLVACASYGQGPPPEFSPAVQANWETYLDMQNPVTFFVSTDGKASFFLWCPGHADRCIDVSSRGGTRSKALRSCEINSGGVPCKIYAQGRRIVWRGTSASKPHTSNAMQDGADAAMAVHREEARQEIYRRVMASVSEDRMADGSTLGSAYSAYQQDKALAVCINWDQSNRQEISSVGWWYIRKPNRRWEGALEALHNCQREYEKQDCNCQVIDRSGENVTHVFPKVMEVNGCKFATDSRVTT